MVTLLMKRDAQRRMIMATITDEVGDNVRVLNGYFPQGENQAHEVKYPAKRKFYADLMLYLNEYHTPNEKIIVMGGID